VIDPSLSKAPRLHLHLSVICRFAEILLKCFRIFADVVHQPDQLTGPSHPDLSAQSLADCRNLPEMVAQKLIFA